MRILCIDVGNTNIHYGLVEDSAVSATGDFSTRTALDDDNGKQLQAAL